MTTRKPPLPRPSNKRRSAPHIDIEGHGATAAALRESEERLRQFGEASSDILWIRDAHTRQWKYLTRAFEPIYGLSREEALTGDNYRNWLDLIIPEDRAAAGRAFDRVCAGEQVVFEYRIRRPSDGKVRWMRDTDFPVVDGSGKVTLIGGIGEDITEARLGQERLEQSEERLRNAVEVGKLGLWDWNVQTGEIHWSDEHFRMEGYEPNEVTPSYDAWASRVHPDDRRHTEDALHRAMQMHHEYVCEFRTLHPDGVVRWLSARGRFFYDDAGQPVRMVGAMMDTTERRESEERQKVLVGELQHRTRNLLSVVRYLADKTPPTEAGLAEFRDRLEALSRVQGLLSRLKDDDRITFDQLIRSELDAMAATADVVTLAGPEGVRLRSSTVQTLAMALHELATNAIKYGALGQQGARLDIAWRLESRRGEAGPWLHIDWRETGVAMPDPASTPPGNGHGRELIEQALPYQLGARTSYVLDADGVHCTIGIPASASTRVPAV